MSIDHLIESFPMRAQMLAANKIVSSKDPCRPLAYMKHFTRMYKDLWSGVDQMRAHGRARLPNWPEWCFMPSVLSYGVLAGKNKDLRQWQCSQPPLISGIAGWRTGQGIYRFDPTIHESLWQTPIEGDIPVEVLLRLPEYCVYIETLGKLSLFHKKLYGFFACLDWCPKTGRRSLNFLIDDEGGLAPVQINLTGGGLRESLRNVLSETFRERNIDDPRTVSSMVENSYQRLAPLVSLVLYLCSEKAELRSSRDDNERPTRPAPVMTRKGARIFPPGRPIMWEVAYRLGAALRAGYEREGTESQGGTHARPRPHIRTAHWQTYWIGHRTESQRPIVRWKAPFLVNAEGPGDLVPVIRRVNPPAPARVATLND